MSRRESGKVVEREPVRAGKNQPIYMTKNTATAHMASGDASHSFCGISHITESTSDSSLKGSVPPPFTAIPLIPAHTSPVVIDWPCLTFNETA